MSYPHLDIAAGGSPWYNSTTSWGNTPATPTPLRLAEWGGKLPTLEGIMPTLGTASAALSATPSITDQYGHDVNDPNYLPDDYDHHDDYDYGCDQFPESELDDWGHGPNHLDYCPDFWEE